MCTPIRVKHFLPVSEMRMFSIILLIFCQEVHSDERTGLEYSTPEASSISTTTAGTTTTSSLYCGADKCDRHSILIYDLEQKFKQLQNDTDDLRSEVEILKEENINFLRLFVV